MHLTYYNFDLENWRCIIDQLYCDGTPHEVIYSIWENVNTQGLPAIIEIYEEAK